MGRLRTGLRGLAEVAQASGCDVIRPLFFAWAQGLHRQHGLARFVEHPTPRRAIATVSSVFTHTVASSIGANSLRVAPTPSTITTRVPEGMVIAPGLPRSVYGVGTWDSGAVAAQRV